MSAGSAFAGTLDEEQTEADFFALVGGTSEIAQIFTVDFTGLLDQVDLRLDTGTPDCDITIEIQPVTGDPAVPTGSVLASETLLAETQFGGGTEFDSILFSSPASVVAGARYAIVVSAALDSFCASVGDSSAAPYSRGHEAGNAGSGWTASLTFDLAFRTYVAPAPPPPPVDTDPPETVITKGVKRSETGKVKFRFESDEAATFECKLKGPDLKRRLRQFRDCGSPRKYKNLDEGRFKFKVRAIDVAGNVDPVPDKDRFRVV